VLTGVIYGAIVVVWAAYLVPLALRRHDEASRSRSIARFSSAMRVLARRGPVGTVAASASARVVLTPKAKDSGPILPQPGSAPPEAVPALGSNRAVARAAAARRRRVLSLLAGLAIVVVLVSLVGVLPRWSPLVPATLIVVFLAVARRSVRQANEAHWVADAAATEKSPTIVVRRSAVRVDAAPRLDDDEPTVTIRLQERVDAVPLETSEGASLWDPLPVTLPSYVSAPVAKRTFRTIELGEPGTWSSGHSEADSETVAASAAQTASAASTKGSPATPAANAAPASAGEDHTDKVAKVVNG
jgi:hypothetical protein